MASKTVNVAPVIVLGILFLFRYAVGATSSNGYEQETQRLALSNVVVVKGTVFCDIRLENPFSDSAYFLPGALVSVDCSINSNRKLKNTNGRVSIEGETDHNGEFRVELPIIQNFSPRRTCSVGLLRSPNDSCNIPSITASSQVTLSSSNSKGIQTYVSTPLSYRPSRKQQQQVIISSLLRRRVLEDSTSKVISSPPSLPNIPGLPKFPFPPFLSIPPLPKLSFSPFPTIPHLNISNIIPPLPKSSVPPLPKLSVPSLPKIPTLPNVPPFPIPNIPKLPKFPFSPLPSIPSPPKLSFSP